MFLHFLSFSSVYFCLFVVPALVDVRFGSVVVDIVGYRPEN